ncbi:hypothetical protein SQW19_08195 [Stenotrophomonas acidaminiphila]|uniref:hypothetical protein n=1 Tax=Stenotrophomonas TaxID=40323 RepID=UPI000CDBF773|nr:hypothetical protein [Stenotrophomonas acidaminiphila]AUZ54967.1 hypothetical protein B1L07_07530 [Stenotrophomonas acidaminiphila]MPS34054.1 hypothetical protein [Stenotrophomonas sp.]WPU57542.1 hypothetical protein SQW19_08195 [Stenotrophomonas acidaminiphila]
MTDTSQGSQSKPVVLLSSLFLVLLCAGSLYILFSGPNPRSSFALFRSGLFTYPIGLAGALLFGRIAWLGFKRLRTL